MAPPRAAHFDLRPFRPIEAMAYSFRTFNHGRIVVTDEERPPCTLDQIVEVTMPLLRCVWPEAVMTRRVML